MISRNELATEIATQHDIRAAYAIDLVDTAVGHIRIHPDLYDADTGQVTDAGAAMIRTQVATEIGDAQSGLR